MVQWLKNPPTSAGDLCSILSQEDLLEKEMAAHSSLPGTLSGKFHGWKSVAGYSPWSYKRVKCNLASKQQWQLQNAYRMLGRVVWSHYECNLGVSGSALTLESWIPQRVDSNPPFPCLTFFYSLHVSVCLFSSAVTMTQAGSLPMLLFPSHSKITLYKRPYPVTEILLEIGACISHFKKLKT